MSPAVLCNTTDNPLRTGGFLLFEFSFCAPCLPRAITFLFFGSHSHMRACFLRDKLYFPMPPFNIAYDVVGSGEKIPNRVKLQKKSNSTTVLRLFKFRRSMCDKTDWLILLYGSVRIRWNPICIGFLAFW